MREGAVKQWDLKIKKGKNKVIITMKCKDNVCFGFTLLPAF